MTIDHSRESALNFLAHLLLSGPDPELRLGNVLADFVKGRAREALAPGVRRGIACHRVIDAFTDAHPIVAVSKGRISQEHRRFAGVLVDVFYDHLLARRWTLHAATPLDAFTAEVYSGLRRHAGTVPTHARGALRRMEEQDWLGSSATLSGVERALSRISMRLGRPGLLTPAVPDLAAQIDDLDADFQRFFPEVRRAVERWLAAASTVSLELTR